MASDCIGAGLIVILAFPQFIGQVLLSKIQIGKSMETFQQFFLVGLGGAVGSIARWQLSSFILRHAIDWRFPLGTFTVNVVGCLVIGLLGGLAIKEDYFSNNMRLLLFTGLMGGFTTFSSFGLETFYLIKRGEYLVAGSNVLLSVLVGMLVLFLGFNAMIEKTQTISP
jgi:CrcB protein